MSVGEIIDRAVTLYVRHAATFLSIALILVGIPFGVAQFIAFQSTNDLQSLLAALGHSIPSHAAGVAHPGTSPALEIVAGLLYIAVTLNVLLFAGNAIAATVGALYVGKPAGALRGIGVALRCWWRMIGFLLLAFFIGIGIALAAAIVAMFVATISGAVGGAFQGAARIAVVLSIDGVALAGALAIILPVTVALALAQYAVAIEGLGAAVAISKGFARVFGEGEWPKAAVVGLVAQVIAFGSTLIGDGVALLLTDARIHVVLVGWNVVTYMLTVSLPAVVTAVYYYDLRIRREGFDLDMALSQLAPAAG